MDMPVYITVSHVLEHLYCPRFTYFEYVLALPERQERRALVLKGRQVHEEREQINPHYLRKKLGAVERQIHVEMASRTLRLKGIVDEVLTLDDGTMAPFDYKFAEDPGHVYLNLAVQSALYGLLVQETFGRAVTRGFLCYTRSNHKVQEIPLGEEEYGEARRNVEEVFVVIQSGVFPPATRWKGRCGDCCYRNICVQ